MLNDSIKVAVSGVGGGVGQSIIKSLQDSDYEVVALDGQDLATGLYAATTAYKIPYASDPAYIESVISICKQENCKVFFPGLDAELPVLSQNQEAFAAAGITVVVSSPEVIEISDDKLLTSQSLRAIGVNTPLTMHAPEYLKQSENLSLPLIFKHRIGGARSQGLYLIKTQDELDSLIDSGVDFDKYVAQEYIEGDEYTCGSITLDGICKGSIVMRRILRDGDTYKCFSVNNPALSEVVEKIANTIKPFGGCNIQLRVRDGVPYVFEINARCSGTTAARALCGFNEPQMILDYLLKDKEPTYQIKELSILRYWKELVIENETIDEFSRMVISPLRALPSYDDTNSRWLICYSLSINY